MNEKLKNIVEALFSNPTGFQAACINELCDKRLFYETNFVSLLDREVNNSYGDYYAELYTKVIPNSIGRREREKIEKEIGDIEESLRTSVSDSEKREEVLRTACASLDNSVVDKFIANINMFYTKPEQFDIAVISACLVTLLDIDQAQIKKFFDVAQKLILATESFDQNLNPLKDDDFKMPKEILSTIQSKCPDKVSEVRELINNARIKEELVNNHSLNTIYCNTGDRHPLRYYKDAVSKLLIKNASNVEGELSIADAIKGFDLEENSNLLKFALDEIDNKVEDYFNAHYDDIDSAFENIEVPVIYAQPLIKLAVFLTVCLQLDKELDDKILFAIADPLSDFLKHIPMNEKLLETIKDISKDISGKEVELAPTAPTPPEGDDIVKPHPPEENHDGTENPGDGTENPGDSTGILKTPKSNTLTPAKVANLMGAVIKMHHDFAPPYAHPRTADYIKEIFSATMGDKNKKTLNMIIKIVLKKYDSSNKSEEDIENIVRNVMGIFYTSTKQSTKISDYHRAYKDIYDIIKKIVCIIITEYTDMDRQYKEILEEIKDFENSDDKNNQVKKQELYEKLTQYQQETTEEAVTQRIMEQFNKILEHKLGSNYIRHFNEYYEEK